MKTHGEKDMRRLIESDRETYLDLNTKKLKEADSDTRSYTEKHGDREN